MLLEKGVSQSTLDARLHIHQGDVRDVQAVKAPLTLDGRPADIIVSGIGITSFGESRREVTLCAAAVANIVAALQDFSGLGTGDEAGSRGRVDDGRLEWAEGCAALDGAGVSSYAEESACG